jgi:hypothetical protein
LCFGDGGAGAGASIKRCLHVDSVKLLQKKLGRAAALNPSQRFQKFLIRLMQAAQFGGCANGKWVSVQRHKRISQLQGFWVFIH